MSFEEAGYDEAFLEVRVEIVLDLFCIVKDPPLVIRIIPDAQSDYWVGKTGLVHVDEISALNKELDLATRLWLWLGVM
jgi:hypothetical protein